MLCLTCGCVEICRLYNYYDDFDVDGGCLVVKGCLLPVAEEVVLTVTVTTVKTDDKRAFF